VIDELFLTAMRRRGLRPTYLTALNRTFRRYQTTVGPLEDATPDSIERWLDGLPIGPGQRHCQIAHLASLFRWAISQGHHPGPSPTDQVLRPRVPQGLPRPIGEEDLARALDTADRPLRMMLRLGAYAGFRAGEVAKFRAEDHSRGTLRIPDGKGGKARAIPAHPSIQLELAGFPARGFLFTKRDGTPITGNRVSQIVGNHFRDLGIDATFHQCRHRFATELLRVSGNLVLVQRLLGHSRIEQTLVYTQLTCSGADEVALIA
jgi:integrase